MNKDRLALNCNEMKISDAPEPREVLLPLTGFDKKRDKLSLKVGKRVITGEQVARGVFSTVTGTVKGIEPLLTGDGHLTAVRVEVSEEEEFDSALKLIPGKELAVLETDPGELLEKKLNRANLGFCEERAEVQTVIVSAVDTDLLTAVSQQVLRESKDIVPEGLKLVQHLTGAERVVLVVPEPLGNLVSDIAGDSIDIYKVKPFYPNGLPEILVRDLARIYHFHSHVFLKVEKLVAAVKALQEDQPFVHKVVTVIDENGAENFRVRIGTPLKDLLKLKGCDLKTSKKIIIGGPFRGYASFSTEIPITEDMDSIYVQPPDETVHYYNNQCMNCGRCVKVCPVNLDVNLICRYSEFSLFEKCSEMGVEVCIECGLCAYYCPSSRSLVQFIRLAKSEIEKLEKEGEEVS
ncbi:MAG: 4Fe-4S binding protein [Candidatus Aminicenantes bacterium]|nr:MAG: 4Fe-4S binding protein [Candidatus Aminicenantes bacterium]